MIHNDVILEEGAIVSESCILESKVKVRPYIRIWPNKIIEEASVVNSSVIWRQRWSSKLFGSYGVTGECNIELTPEFAAKLGSAFGAMLGKGSYVTSSMDGHKASRMISRGLISGLLASGVNVSNLENVPIPINRYELKFLRSKGGIHVRKSPFDPNLIDIKFFDSDGMDLSPNKEKSIERLFWGEDYERGTIEDIGELSFPFYRVAEGYKEGLVNFVNAQNIKNRGFKIVIDFAYGSASSIYPSILGELNCETIAINANADDKRLTKTTEDFEKSLKQLAQIVVTLNANFGVMFDSGAEKMFLVDDKGNILSGEDLLGLFSYLVINSGKASKISVPITETSVIDELAKKAGVSVIRSKTSLRSMMETASHNHVQFFGESYGGYIFPEFQPAFDAMLSTTKLLDLLSATKSSVSEILATIPRKHLIKEHLPCPNAIKGAIIRSLVDSEKEGTLELIDGVKINLGENWVLVNGHPDKQEIYIFSESKDASIARKNLLKYKEKIKKVIDQQLGK